MSTEANLLHDVDSVALSQLLPGINPASPSPDSIASLYKLVLSQATDLATTQRELDGATSLSDKREVELDQALQDRERLSQELDSKVDSLQQQLTKLQHEKQELTTSQSNLQAEITRISSSNTSSSSQLTELQRRLDDTEREKRDLVGVISRLKQEGTHREEEIQTLRTNLKEARQDHQSVESQVRELRSSEAATKFKLDSVTQQLELSQTETTRLGEELAEKTDEFTKYRRAKQTELLTLQAQVDNLTQSEASTQASLKALQSAHSSQTQQLTQALTKVQDLSSQLAEQEATYSTEAAVLRRLVSALEEREKQAQDVVRSVEHEWDTVAEKADRRETLLREEIERERQLREEAEKKLQTMGTVMDKVGKGELPVPDPAMHGMIGLSPTVAMASRVQRSGKSFTEVYADYVRLQEDYAKKSTEYDRMDQTLTAVLAQIEERAPILSQQRIEYERLQSEASQLATQLGQALAERDAQANAAQETSQKLSKTTRENQFLQQQLEDLGLQVQTLLKEIERRDDPSIPPDDELEAIPPSEDVDALITNNLVRFRSVSVLQQQNQKLLKITRELGQKMENDERDYREALEKEQGEAVREAHQAMLELSAQLENQKKTSDSLIKAYVKERDALKAMLARAGNQTVVAEVNGTGQVIMAGAAASPDLAKELAEVQGRFNAYTTEMGVDVGKLRGDLQQSQREATQLSSNLAKSQARCEYLQERLRMNQEQAAVKQQELEELSKRNTQLFDQWTRLDIECGRVTEDLQTSTGLVERLRNECANLRAEKKIWESLQTRLMEENKTLTIERSHLSDLMTNIQKMHNDVDRSNENDRRRLESQVQMYESQNQDLRAQLSQERDTNRHLSLQKEIEHKDLQNRIDKINQEFSKTRESLVSAETSKKHLEERVTGLTKQLQGNEEKLAVYERRPMGGTVAPRQDMSHEQQLEVEVAELRAALKVAEVDLATARSHIQQFKDMSQASEAALESLNTTYDQYKSSTEAQIAHNESEIKALKDKLDAALQEISQFNNKYEELQKTLETERAAWTSDRKTLEDTIVDLTMSEKSNESDRNSRENEVRQQEELVKAAEQRYSHEVVAHAESLKALNAVKQQLQELQNASRENATTAETAKAKLQASESSWQQQREVLDKEIANLNARCKDLESHNSQLLQHLDTVTSQATRIRQVANSSVPTTPGTTEGSTEGETANDTLAELRSIMSYLRREKDIVDLQLEVSKQETSRQKAQIEHLSQTLDETRAALSEERERAAKAAGTDAQHAELVERINQMNVLRESNAMLRAESEKHSKRAQQLEAQVQRLTAQLEPLKEQARTSRAEVEARDAQMKRLEEESRRWQERNTQLLTKYDRIDPAEMQSLRDEIERLKQQSAESGQTRATQNEKVASLEASVTSLKQNINNRTTQFKNIREVLMKEKSALQEQVKEQEATIASLRTQTNELMAARVISDAEKSTTSLNATVVALQQERDQLLAEKATWAASTATVAPPDGSTTWEAEKLAIIKARDDAVAELKMANAQLENTQKESRNHKFAMEKMSTRLAEWQKARQTDAEKAKVQTEEAVAAAVEKFKNERQPTNASTPSPSDSAKHTEELKALEARLAAKYTEDLKAAVEAARKESAAANTSLDKQAIIAAALAEQEKAFETKLKTATEEALEAGRKEQATKTKVKDSQLVRANKTLRKLEKRVRAAKELGMPDLPEVPDSPTTSSPPALPPVSGNTAAKPQAPPAIGITTAATTSTTTENGATALPSASTTAVPTATAPATGAATPGVPRKPATRGRVAPRGGAPARGAAPTRGGAAGRGGAPPAPSSQISIIGAAGLAKRPREEGTDDVGDTALAKRIKPEAPKAGAPVAIKRPPPSSS